MFQHRNHGFLCILKLFNFVADIPVCRHEVNRQIFHFFVNGFNPHFDAFHIYLHTGNVRRHSFHLRL